MNEAKTQIFSKELSNAVKQTNWYIITGSPGSCKTTAVDLLNARGYKTTIEHDRQYLDTKCSIRKTVEEVRKNKAAFQLGILGTQVEQEKLLSPDDVVFPDRNIADALALF